MRTRLVAQTIVGGALIGSLLAQQPEITNYPLHARVRFPEGIAYDPKDGNIYTGSAVTGLIFRVVPQVPSSTFGTIVTREGTAIPGEVFPAALGMELDGSRLWVAGGRSGRMAVLDTGTGRVVKQFETPATPQGLIDDVAVVNGTAYFTDSSRPTLWRVATKRDQIGAVEAWLQFKGSPLVYESGTNLGGIAATTDGRSLIVVQTNKGLLFRISLADRKITPIDVGDEALTSGDGLALDGQTLYVVRQVEQEIVTIELSADLSKGRVRNRFRNTALRWPAGAVKVGDRLLVVNTQFNTRNTNDPVTPFSIVGIPLSLLAGK